MRVCMRMREYVCMCEIVLLDRLSRKPGVVKGVENRSLAVIGIGEMNRWNLVSGFRFAKVSFPAEEPLNFIRYRLSNWEGRGVWKNFIREQNERERSVGRREGGVASWKFQRRNWSRSNSFEGGGNLVGGRDRMCDKVWNENENEREREREIAR